MPTINPTSPPPATATPAAAAAPLTAATEAAATATTVDALGAAVPVDTTAISGPQAVAAAQSLPRIPEAFPIGALDKLDAKGLQGQTFMLDAGSLRGMKLQIRRVQDGDEKGFDVLFKVHPNKLDKLLEAMDKREAKACGLVFRGLELDADGVAKYTSASGQISSSGTHAPSDLDTNAAKWVKKADGPKGGTIEVVHNKAAQAVRGLVRIQVRGDDAASSKQLDGIIKGLGLGYLFAPPTIKSKRNNMLMRALWQADNKKAVELSKGDLDKLKPADLEKALADAGWSADRIAGLRYEEVFDGHFTAVDPQQAEDMARAGARYLYSTVTKPEHVLSMLTGGQKSSMQRYKEGMIINGMSTNSDFTTGGAVGVFTRVVTLGAIYDNKSWTGRTYKLIQNYKQLGRTDWYGWNGDKFGRRWQLDSGENFGTNLLGKIESKSGSYASSNELIFTGGNTPSNVDRVVATTADARKTLIEFLSKEGYEPHNGLPLEDFVVLSPKFLVHGPAPYEAEDPKKFSAEAIAEAKDGKTIPLRWFLTEGPTDGGHRAKTEQALLTEGEAKLVDVVVQAAKTNGKLAMTTKQLDALVESLQGSTDDKAKTTLNKLTSTAAEALFRSNGDKAAALLETKKPSSSGYSAYGIDDDGWVRIFNDLIEQQPAGGRSPALTLALDVRAKYLLDRAHTGFLAFVKAHPLVSPGQPKAWVTKEVKKLVDGGSSTDLALFLAQVKSPEDAAWANMRLIEADNPKTLELLQSSLKVEHDLGLGAAEVKTLLGALPDNSKTKKYLLASEPDALMKTGDPDVMKMVTDHHKNNSYFNLYDQKRWGAVVDKLFVGGEVTPMLRDVMERGASYLMQSKEFVAKLADMQGLYALDDPKAFVEAATKELSNGKPGHLKLGWLLGGPKETEPHRPEAIYGLLANGNYEARQVVDRLRAADPDGRMPLDDKQVFDLLKRFDSEDKSSGIDYVMRNAGKQLLLSGNAKVLTLLDKHVGDQGLGKLSLNGQTLTATLTELSKKTGAQAKEIETWALGQAASYAIQNNDKAVLEHLSAAEVSFEAAGLDAGAVADLVKKSFERNKYYYTNSSSYSGYENLPIGAAWGMNAGGGALDDAMLEAVEEKLPQWKWDKKLFEAFVKRLPDLSADWEKRLTKAHKLG